MQMRIGAHVAGKRSVLRYGFMGCLTAEVR